MTDQDKKDLECEIQHIFDSGANEIRIQEMVENFINSRGGLRSSPNPNQKRWYKITTNSCGFGQGKKVDIVEFTPEELQRYVNNIGEDLGPMLDMWVEKVENL